LLFIDFHSKFIKFSDNVPAKESIKGLTSPKITVQNIVISGELHATIDLYAFSKGVKDVDYEPEQFPGAIFRVYGPTKISVIIYKNGKLICTGARTKAEIKRVLDHVVKVISKYVIAVES